jgi:hypothetical protein
VSGTPHELEASDDPKIAEFFHADRDDAARPGGQL